MNAPITKAEVAAGFAEFRDRYMSNCALFAREMLGATPRDWQHEVADDLSRGEKLITICSARSRGKTAEVAQVILWWILTRFPQKTIVTAPASGTIIDGIWPEIGLWAAKLPPVLRQQFEITADRIVIKGVEAESFVTAKTAREDRPEALQGIHAAHVLVIVDEASGVSERAMEALMGSLAGDDRRMMLISNGTRTSGTFYRTHHDVELIRSGWVRYQISALPLEGAPPGTTETGTGAEALRPPDADPAWVPPVKRFYCPVPGDESFIPLMRSRFGEDSTPFRVHVRGEFPRGEDDTVIPMHLIEDACNRDVEPSGAYAAIWGLDVARFGDDSTALCKRVGNVVPARVERWRGKDLMQTVMLVKAQYDACMPSDRPSDILVDSIGVGAGVVDRLRELGLPVRGINVSESPALAGTHLNLRAELWFKARAWLEQRHCRLPKDDEELHAELVAPRYKFSERGDKIKIESKAEIKARGLPSPDKADAFVLTFAAEAAIAGATGNWSSSWNKPLRRGLSIV